MDSLIRLVENGERKLAKNGDERLNQEEGKSKK